MPERSLTELKSMVGTSKRIVEGMQIEAGKVAEFARAIGCESPEYYDEEAATSAGLEGIPAPVTFLRTSVFPRYRPDGMGRDPVFDLGFEKRREVHGEHAIEFERPIYVGDTLSATATLADVYQRESDDGGAMTFAVQEIDYADETNEPVATERMTVIELPGDGRTEDTS
ncbi:FAS1-like dehydratase domain-containing protein [Natrarchaeobius halalkaliphilus]|uniref:FAS1-like dehydratase domain-containing protein n=1 Tax=Natrarchaeobius halalkaliphilus TaxID=1679091 RepID=UPI001FB2E93B|nr:MaoC family dehydratase N-terminal domain-containing protein [Natrarchaeobius halalkaliphilus]